MMVVLVVTGGIGSGKSLVCRILQEKYGIPVYEADSRAKCLYTECPAMLERIEMVLGRKFRSETGTFAAPLLAEVIFNDADALKQVEEILFPVMKKDFTAWAERQDTEVVAFESATVLEKPQFCGFGDIVLLVDAPLQTRIARSMARDGVSKERVIARINAQPLMNSLSEGGVDERISHVIVNNVTEDILSIKIEDFIEKYGLTKKL